MRQRATGNRELLALAALFVCFIGAVAYYTRIGNEALPRTAPSSLNARPPGAKALFLLYNRLGYSVDRLEADWRTLSSGDGLLIIIEPLTPDRAPTTAEMAALRRWVEEGGAILYSVTAPPRPFDNNDPVAGDLEVVPGKIDKEEVAPAVADSPYLRNVRSITAQCPVRLKPGPGAPYETLFKDASGAIVLHKRIGKGNLIVAADDRLLSNEALSEADNAIFAVNVATAGIDGSARVIQFDEYHHGAGFESAGDSGETAGIWSSTPLPLKLALLHLLGLSALLIYNGNRRFGAARVLFMPSYRRSTDYLGSMARLLRRANAADIATETLYERFHRDLTRKLDLPPNASSVQMVDRLQRRYAIDGASLGTLIDRCQQIARGERIEETEMLTLAQQIEGWRRRLGLGGV